MCVSLSEENKKKKKRENGGEIYNKRDSTTTKQAVAYQEIGRADPPLFSFGLLYFFLLTLFPRFLLHFFHYYLVNVIKAGLLWKYCY